MFWRQGPNHRELVVVVIGQREQRWLLAATFGADTFHAFQVSAEVAWAHGQHIPQHGSQPWA